jgi:hypothetical protein
MQLLRGKNILPAILFLIVVILVILMVSNTTYIPYTRNEMFPKYGTYEGLTSSMEMSSSSELEGSPLLQGNVSVQGNTDVNGNTLVSESAFDSPSSVLSSLFGKSAEGFSGSIKTNINSINDNEIIDRFSHVSDTSSNNDNKCPSGGLTNSKGALCLTPELVQLLKTRGGNM